jgi:hypothetical protein
MLLVMLAAVVALAGAASPVAAQPAERCFPETGFCISGRIRAFWEQNGALPVFGFPIGPQQEMTLEGKPVQAQLFQRNRLELHPENAPPYDVLLGRLGVDGLVYRGRDWFTFPKSGNQPGCRYFPDTDHSVCGEFLAAWHANGLEIDGRAGKTEGESLALWGLPLSGVMNEQLSDGKFYEVQWFERARFELHPENAPPYHVLFGLLGNELATGTQPPAPAQPRPLPPPSFNNCQADPNPDAAPNYPVAIVALDKRGELVTLRNVGQEPVDLAGWRLCSIKGNQEISVSGVLALGASQEFRSPDGTTWNNSERDDAALYNPAGQLVSYWVDR